MMAGAEEPATLSGFCQMEPYGMMAALCCRQSQSDGYVRRASVFDEEGCEGRCRQC